jgi:glycosyltransferase involved in cell wall biosynthesis
VKSIYIFSNIYPRYRKEIWDRLYEDENHNISFFFSNKTINNIATVSVEKEYSVNDQKAFKEIDNIFLDKWLIWQKGVISKTFNSVSAVIFLGEITIISTWIASFILRLRGVKVLFWGHGIYGNESLPKLLLRKMFLRLANHNLVYEKRAKKLMIEHGFKQNKTSVVYNSINYEQQLNLFQKLEKEKNNSIFKNNCPVLLFVGRLTKQKKVNQLIEAAKILNEKSNFNLLIIGEGEEKQSLEELAQDLIKENKCIFYGKSYDEDELSRLIYNSDLTVSPGNVGLTAIHSLSYGIPVCSHSNLSNQMPEVESIIEGENGFLFRENDVLSIVNGIISWFDKKKSINKKKIRGVVDKFYNPIYQKEIILKSIN